MIEKSQCGKMNSKCFYNLSENRILVALPFKTRLYLKGKVQIDGILSNEVHIFGGKFGNESEFPIEIYSPRGYSLLYIEACKCDEKLNEIDLSSFNKDDEIIINVFTKSEFCAVFVLSKLQTPWTENVENLLRFSDTKRQRMALFGREKWRKDVQIVPDFVEETLDASLIAPSEFEGVKVRLMELNEEWENVVRYAKYQESVSGQKAKIVGTGGKGVGKSTMLKYITNRLIQDGPVLWIDLDPGQAEFTLPGCLSCTVLKKPLIGPNFTHLASEVENVLNIYLGSVNVSDVLSRYKSCVKYIKDFLKSDKKWSTIPWIVNTMGFNRGLGIPLLKETLKLINPTTVIEIRSRNPRKNYECSLNNFIKKSVKDCNYMSFNAIPESLNVEGGGQDQVTWGIPEAYKLRDIVTLSYLEKSNVMSNPFYHQVPLDSIHIQLLQCSGKQTLASELALKMALVSLGSKKASDDEMDMDNKKILGNDEIIPSKGFGVVVGVNHEEKLLYLKTALNDQELSSINCLTSGSILVPNGYLLKNGKPGHPYVHQKPITETPLNVPWQRSAKPILKEFQAKANA